MHATRHAFWMMLALSLVLVTCGVTGDSLENDQSTASLQVFYGSLLEPTLGGLLALVDPGTGLPYDVGAIGAEGVVSKDAKTSPTNVGLLVSGLVVARDRGLLPAEEVEARLLRIATTLEGMETWKGFFYNWYDLAGCVDGGPPPVGAPSVDEAARRFVSSIDNANLTASMMVAAGAFPGSDLASRLESLIARQDYAWFYRDAAPSPDEICPRISHGYNVSQGSFSAYDYGTFMTEARLLVFLALALGQVPTYPWASTEPGAVGYMDATPVICPTAQGPVIAIGSWGGSLFEELYPDLFLDEKLLANDLAENHRRVVEVHEAHADAGTGLWGWSPSQSCECAYKEAGVACLGVGGGYPLGDVSAYSLCLAARYAPVEAARALSNLAQLVPEAFDPAFGYCDSVSQDGTKHCADLLSLDKGMELLGLAAVVCDLSGEPTVSRHLWAYLDAHGAGDVGRQLMDSVTFPSRWASVEPICECADAGRETDALILFGSAGQGGGGHGSMNGVVDGFEWVHPTPTLLVYDVTAPDSFAYFTVLSVNITGSKKPVPVGDYNAVRVRYDGGSAIPCQFRIELKAGGAILQSFVADVSRAEGSEAVAAFNGGLLESLDEITLAVDHRLASSCADGSAAGSFRIEGIELLCLPLDQ